MSSLTEHLSKLREDRIAREKARIEKLRELNLKKYGKTEIVTPRPSTSTATKADYKRTNPANVPKNNFHVNGTTKKPISVPNIVDKKQVANKKSSANFKPNNVLNGAKLNKPSNFNGKIESNNIPAKGATEKNIAEKLTRITEKPINTFGNTSKIPTRSPNTNTNNVKKHTDRKEPKRFNFNKNARGDNTSVSNNNNKLVLGQNYPKFTRKSCVPRFEPSKTSNKPKTVETTRKSLQPPRLSQSASKVNLNRQSVFERLYQPKIVPKKQITDNEKLRTDPEFFKKMVNNTALILNKRHTICEPKKAEPTVRRSISAVHFKRISKDELSNCIHKWSSIGDNLDKAHLEEINEDEHVKQDKIVSAVKSERKRVKFQTPNFNTPRPEELQARLQNWLKKRGKSIDSYHHLQCFGIHHMAQKEMKPLNLEATKFEDDDEDKENQPLESDSDNDSYDEMNNKNNDTKVWRRASYVSDSVDLNETRDSTIMSSQMHHVEELLLGALNDLTELLREGFEWEQCARWLRAIRERFPAAPAGAAYWECRAALEERRGDLAASVHCWGEAIAKGTERSIVEANLDQLMAKFVQLKISPTGGNKQPTPKMVADKNMCKSTVIRFAVLRAKQRQSQEPEKFTLTPVRRSGRIMTHVSEKHTASVTHGSEKRAPLQVCSSVRQADLLGHDITFVPNDTISGTP